METEDWVFGLGEDFDRDEFNAEQGYPEGSTPSVTGPNPVSTGSRKESSEIYAYGGQAGYKVAPWLVEAQQHAKDKANAAYKAQKKHRQKK